MKAEGTAAISWDTLFRMQQQQQWGLEVWQGRELPAARDVHVALRGAAHSVRSRDSRRSLTARITNISSYVLLFRIAGLTWGRYAYVRRSGDDLSVKECICIASIIALYYSLNMSRGNSFYSLATTAKQNHGVGVEEIAWKIRKYASGHKYSDDRILAGATDAHVRSHQSRDGGDPLTSSP